MMKLLIHSQTSTAAPLKFGNGYVISSQTLVEMGVLIHAGIQSWSLLVKRAPVINQHGTDLVGLESSVHH